MKYNPHFTIALFLFFGINSTLLFGQDTVEKVYYKNIYKNERVQAKQAKYVETITTKEDGMTSYEFRRIKGDHLVKSYHYKDKMPHGVWKSYNQRKGRYSELDYDFDISYSDQKVEDGIYIKFDTGELESEPSGTFIPPKIKGATSNPVFALYKNIKFPAYARENGISGTSKIHLKITKEGKLELISIFEGAEPHLDKESARALRSCQDWEPATLNGEKVETYAIVPVKFKLE